MRPVMVWSAVPHDLDMLTWGCHELSAIILFPRDNCKCIAIITNTTFSLMGVIYEPSGTCIHPLHNKTYEFTKPLC